VGKLTEKIFLQDKHICPWWLCFTFDNVFRRYLHEPEEIVGPYVHPGDTVLDVGPGMGYFTIPIARLVGPNGLVIAADIQGQMLRALTKRANRARLAERIRPHLSTARSIGIPEKVDFALAFWMIHEVPSKKAFIKEIRSTLKSNALFLLVEPLFHVSGRMFRDMVKSAEEAGLVLKERPKILLSRSALFRNGGNHL
jgi:ubiquinone/menaquinone biosynthesis C-methylase UbiE